MNRICRKLALLLALCCATLLESVAQDFVWNANFDFRFDNREYGDKNEMISPAQTLFGAHLSPEVGIGWQNGHSLMTGLTLPADMGSSSFMGRPEWLAYYNYSTKRVNLMAGLIPRSKMIGDYSNAFFSDSTRFNDRVLDGVLLQYKNDNHYIEFGCDWCGKTSDIQRERFMLMLAGRAWKGYSYAGYAFTMFHYAGSKTVRGVVDNALGSIYMGIDLAEVWYYDLLYAQVAYIQGYHNDRKWVGTPVFPGGFEVEICAEKYDVGVKNTLYKGKNLMPYYDSPHADSEGNPYGNSLYLGDPFYRTGQSGIYNRLELYYQPKLRGGVRLKMSSVHHFDGNRWGWQQVIGLSIYIDEYMM